MLNTGPVHLSVKSAKIFQLGLQRIAVCLGFLAMAGSLVSRDKFPMELRTIADLLGRHEGAEAWIFGKGPGLDHFAMNSAGPLRICINESLIAVPNASYFFAHDEPPILRVSARWPEGCRAILTRPRAELAIAAGMPADSISVYEKRERDLEPLNWSADRIAQESCLVGLTGTVHSAIHFCRLIGIASITFVGMDGRGAYAKSIGLQLPPGDHRHDRIRRDSEMVCERMQMNCLFL